MSEAQAEFTTRSVPRRLSEGSRPLQKREVALVTQGSLGRKVREGFLRQRVERIDR
jgi:hypothetical protein